MVAASSRHRRARPELGLYAPQADIADLGIRQVGDDGSTSRCSPSSVGETGR